MECFQQPRVPAEKSPKLLVLTVILQADALPHLPLKKPNHTPAPPLDLATAQQRKSWHLFPLKHSLSILKRCHESFQREKEK